MGNEATVLAIKSVGPRTRFVQFKTEHGWTRVEVGTEVSIKVSTFQDDDDHPTVGEVPPADSIPYQGKHFKSV